MKRIVLVLVATVLFIHPFAVRGQYSTRFKNLQRAPHSEKSLARPVQKSDLQTLSHNLSQCMAAHGRRETNPVIAKQRISTVQQTPAGLSMGTAQVWRDEKTGLPVFVNCRWPEETDHALRKASAEEKAFRFLNEKKELIQLKAQDEEFKVHRVVRDPLGETHLRLQQIYKGLDVWGKEIVVHIGNDGLIRGFNGRYAPTPSTLVDLAERIAPDEAISRVKSDLNAQSAKIDLCEKKIYIHESGEPVLVWHVIVRFGFQRWYYFIDAKTGDVVHCIDYTMTDGPTTGTGVDLAGQTQTVQLYQVGAEYYLVDCSKPMFVDAQSQIPDIVAGGIMVVDIRNQELQQDALLYYIKSMDRNSGWAANAVSMEVSVSRVYDYYRNVHNRNSIDNQAMTIYSVINLGQSYNNAFWNGYFLCFGNGDGVRFSDIAGAFDVIGHEYTHGVTQHTSNLIYENQSGALNEAMSDIFGALSEWYHEGANGNWLIGEDVYTPGNPGDALRDMEFPSGPRVDNPLPATMSEFQNLPNTQEGDWGGVHVNCSIVSRAAVLIAQNADVNPDAGRQKMGAIFYRAQTVYLTQSSQFIDARLACVRAAQDLYGTGGTEEQAVKNAFDTVEIFDGTGTQPPPEYPSVEGNDYIIAKGTGDGALYRYNPAAGVVEPLTWTTVTNRPSVTDDGSTILFVDGGYDMVGINSDGTGETNLTVNTIFEGLMNSVSVSPNDRYVAFTLSPFLEDATIYFLDLVQETGFEYPLYSPITQTSVEPVYDVLFADAMDWDFENTYLLYDCYHENSTSTGIPIAYWSISQMRISDGTIYNVFPYQPQGVSVGNPVFTSNNDYIFAYDYVDAFNNTAIYAANLETGDEGVIMADNYGQFGFPTYNPQDNTVAFHSIATDGFNVFDCVGYRTLSSDKINGTGEPSVVLTNATFPVWFAIGNRTDVEEGDPTIPLTLALGDNYPNPFNPFTTIPFQIPRESPVRLVIYNMLGEQVAVLVDETMAPGSYRFRWEAVDGAGRQVPSGVYVYRLDVGDKRISRKMILMR